MCGPDACGDGDKKERGTRAMDAFMIVQRGEDIGRRFDIDTTQLTIGRGSDNDLVLNDPMVSRYHAVVKRQGNRFSLIDLGSSNPVVVNDQVLEPGMAQQLNHRDVIFVGKTVFSFQNRTAGAGQQSARTPTPPNATTRPDVAATQMGGGRDFDSMTPPPPPRATPAPQGNGATDDKTMIAAAPEPGTIGDGDAKTQIVGIERSTPPAPPTPFPAAPAPIEFDDSDETRTGVSAPPPPNFSPPPPPNAGDRLIGTPPNEEDGDLPTQIIPRR